MSYFKVGALCCQQRYQVETNWAQPHRYGPERMQVSTFYAIQ